MLAIERGRLAHVKAARSRIIRIIEPEANMESVDRVWIALIWIESENLIEKNRADRGGELPFRTGLQIALVPSHSKILEGAVDAAAGFQIASLNRPLCTNPNTATSPATCNP